MVVGATLIFWPLMRHGAGAGYSGLYSSFFPAPAGRSHHRDPCREEFIVAVELDVVLGEGQGCD